MWGRIDRITGGRGRNHYLIPLQCIGKLAKRAAATEVFVYGALWGWSLRYITMLFHLNFNLCLSYTGATATIERRCEVLESTISSFLKVSKPTRIPGRRHLQRPIL